MGGLGAECALNCDWRVRTDPGWRRTVCPNGERCRWEWTAVLRVGSGSDRCVWGDGGFLDALVSYDSERNGPRFPAQAGAKAGLGARRLNSRLTA